MVLLAGMPAVAHRLDEYLQATLISMEKDRVQAEIRLVPGVAVFPIVLAGIDTNGDGVISQAEQRAYAERVLRDLSLTMDGDRLRLQLVTAKFPGIPEMRDGMGEIQLELTADLPRSGPNRRLVFENHHQSRIGAYLVNCLVPRDPDIRITAQNRNYTQSFYQLDYVQAGVPADPLSIPWWGGGRLFLSAVALLLHTRFLLLWRRAGGRRFRIAGNIQARLAEAIQKMLDQFRIQPLRQLSARPGGTVRTAGDQFVQRFRSRLTLAQLPIGGGAGDRRPEVARHLDAERGVHRGAIVALAIGIENGGEPIPAGKVRMQPHGGIGHRAASLPEAGTSQQNSHERHGRPVHRI